VIVVRVATIGFHNIMSRGEIAMHRKWHRVGVFCLASMVTAGWVGFRRGDANADGEVDLSDGSRTLGHLFLGQLAPPCLDAADADDSGELELTDAVFTFAHLFLGGPPPDGHLIPRTNSAKIRYMDKKSDSTGGERLSATEASRSFSELLDRVEAGRRFLIQRHGRDVCVMAPPSVDGRRASECLSLLRSRTPVLLDDKFSEDLQAILSEETSEERPAWDS
jgi:antitoxin (DNA-binding transcriptional repressor) of toxin-antitoxin stability system